MLPARSLPLVILLAGCARPVAAPAPAPAPAPMPAPVASTPLAEPAAATTIVFIDKAGIRLAEPRVLVPLPSDPSLGADARYKRSGPNDLYLVPLGEALAEEKAKGRIRLPLSVVVEESTPYRMLIETLLTAGQSDIGEYVVHEGSLTGRSFPFLAPRAANVASEPPRESLGLKVLIVSGGLSIKTAFGNVAPGCSDTGPGLAIPRREARLDLVLLASCLGRVRAANPSFASEREVMLVANPEIPFRDLMDVALTVAGPNRELFSSIGLGVAR
jgi:hypothetical protein